MLCMKDFVYNFRKFFLNSRRRHRPGARNFGLNFRKDPVFRIKVVLLSLLAAVVVVFILLITVIPDNPVKAFFNGDDIKEIDMQGTDAQGTPTKAPTEQPTITPEPSQDPNEPTATPLSTAEEKSTTTGWITAESGLVVRTGPSTQHAKLGTIPFGAKVEIIEQGAWHFIEYKEGGGYIHSNYVYISDTPPGGTETQSTNTAQTWTYSLGSTDVVVEEISYDGATYYTADIKADAQNVLTEYNMESQKPTEMVMDKNSALAINGDYFGFRDEGIIIRNGELVRDTPYGDLAVLFDDGELKVYSANEVTAAELDEQGALQSWSFGPILVKDSKSQGDFSAQGDLNLANPRTGIGMIEPGHYVFIVVDGRQESSRGLTLDEFAKIFEDLGCKTAYNLDGGGTSIMLFKGEIISSPSGTEERSVSDVIYVK